MQISSAACLAEQLSSWAQATQCMHVGVSQALAAHGFKCPVQALSHAMDLVPDHKQICQELQQLKSFLTLEQLTQVHSRTCSCHLLTTLCHAMYAQSNADSWIS